MFLIILRAENRIKRVQKDISHQSSFKQEQLDAHHDFWRTFFEFDYDKLVAQIFFIGSLFYLFLAFMDKYNPDFEWYDLIDKFTSHLFVVDAIAGILGWYTSRTTLNDALESNQVKFKRRLFSLDPYVLDFSGWGDWLFLLGSFLDAAISYLRNDELSWKLTLVSDSLWTVDAILYCFAYYFGQSLRRKKENAYYTSLDSLS
eukprot:snap_masked-scaffold_8-processed-gene-8.39-mRNA-1 protein AED:1.00 eAED:1.00 QI:0/0/0/0/1/1/2/0/201